MRRLFTAVVVLAIAVFGLGYYLEWFRFSTDSGSDKVNINMSVDKKKVHEDEEKAKEKLGEIRDKVKEKTGDLGSKSKKETGKDRPSDKQP